MSVMRTSLLPGLLETLASNYRRQWRRIRVFEMGNVFHGAHKRQSQVCRLAGAMTGDVATQQWDTSDRNVDFYDIKGHVEGLFRICGHTLEDWLEACPHAALHPAQSARVFRGRKTIGWIGRLHPEVQKHFSIEQPVYTCLLYTSPSPRDRSVSRMPSSA